MTSVIVRPIEFPVAGKVSWTDTYGACRDGCSRKHEGQDLIGAKLQKLIACVDGTVVGFQFAPAGNYLYLEDSDGWHYGYLHINNDDPGTDDGANPRQWAFAPGIALGSTVRKGQHIAYLGDSGNAEATVPHCHFEIRKPADAWYHAQAINAKYSLIAASHGVIAGVPPATFVPWSTASGFVGQQYLDFVNRGATTGEMSTWTPQLDRGDKSPSDLVEWIIHQPGSDDVIAPLVRLYLGSFGRLPDTSGLMYWIGQARARTSLDQIADAFAGSGEFRRRYGSLDASHFVEQMYHDLLGRPSDPGGHAYWVQRLAAGMSRGRLVRNFVETSYYRFVTFAQCCVCMVYAGMLRRAPDQGGYDYWLGQINGGMPLQTMIKSLQVSSEYRRRFPGAV